MRLHGPGHGFVPDRRCAPTDRGRDQEKHADRPRRQPYKGNPAELARSAIKQCPAVGAAMYQQKCAGNNEAAPQCQEMKGMIDQAR
jgi:hypothetical protein